MSEQFMVEDLRRHVASLVKTEEEVHRILHILEETDWPLLITEAQLSQQRWQEDEQEQRKMKEALNQKPVRCGRCRKVVLHGQLAYPRLRPLTFQRKIPKHDYKFCCPECRKAILEKYTRICKICQEQFIHNKHQDTCPQCWWKDPKNLSAQVKTQLARARKNKTEATLTVKQWQSTVEHFGGKCAYCQRDPMEVLDHFIPISQGGGTTEDNCVPVCDSCNLHKTDYIPSDLSELIYIQRYIDIKIIKNVHNYLSSKKE